MKSFHLQGIARDIAIEWLQITYGYICNDDNCDVNTDLCIDHIVPKSVKIDHNIYNLQLLCRQHNSEKFNNPSKSMKMRWRYLHIREYQQANHITIAKELKLSSESSLRVWKHRSKDTFEKYDIENMIFRYDIFKTSYNKNNKSSLNPDIIPNSREVYSHDIQATYPNSAIQASYTDDNSTDNPPPGLHPNGTIPEPSLPEPEIPLFPYQPFQWNWQQSVPIPTFNDVYAFIKGKEDHVHHDYFTKLVRRGDNDIPQIIVNQALITKVLDIIRDMQQIPILASSNNI